MPQDAAAPNVPPLAVSTARVPNLEDLCDWYLEHPKATLAQIATAFGLSLSWMRAIISNDAFKDTLARRRERTEADQTATVATQLGGLAVAGLDALQSRTDTYRDNPGILPTSEIRENTKMALEGLGIGRRGGGVPGGTTVSISVDANLLAVAREHYHAKHAGPVLDHQPAPELPPGGTGDREQLRLPGAVSGADDAGQKARNGGGDQV